MRDGAAADLDPALGAEVVALDHWLLGEAARTEDAGEVLAGLAERLDGVGVPVDRITTAIEVLHSEYAGVGRFWTREEGATVRLFPHGDK
ncbi:MAG TPA: adenylate/guanylate cyclase domain-containing protein, partial [Beijerinckiaceae bacterium]|nr:adenylate/guanylate cyclase domain-containing protein [Beijerinckiaceae bacterium]